MPRRALSYSLIQSSSAKCRSTESLAGTAGGDPSYETDHGGIYPPCFPRSRNEARRFVCRHNQHSQSVSTPYDSGPSNHASGANAVSQLPVQYGDGRSSSMGIDRWRPRGRRWRRRKGAPAQPEYQSHSSIGAMTGLIARNKQPVSAA